MSGIPFIIVVILMILALLSVTSIIIRGIRRNKNWKLIGPELIKKVENALGEEVVHHIMLNANDTDDFSHGKGFLLWIAFTSDHIAFVNRDFISDGNDSFIYLSKRTDVSIKRLNKRFMELKFKDKKSSERLVLTVFVRACDAEILNAFIPNKIQG